MPVAVEHRHMAEVDDQEVRRRVVRRAREQCKGLFQQGAGACEPAGGELDDRQAVRGVGLGTR